MSVTKKIPMKKEQQNNSLCNFQDCAKIHALEVIGGKWRLPLIYVLSTAESMRYNELKRHLEGITNIMLTRSLQSLETYGLLIRTDYREIPPRVEYALTQKGRDLLPALEFINEWGKDLLHHPARKQAI